jgi:hypothetical protein
MTAADDGWSRDVGDDADDEDEDIVYDDDEDEFGLPSISSMQKKRTKGINQSKTVDSGSAVGSNPSNLGFGLGSNRQRANSSDIAEERGPPMYPTTRKGEGKILRPQYKEILKGECL